MVGSESVGHATGHLQVVTPRAQVLVLLVRSVFVTALEVAAIAVQRCAVRCGLLLLLWLAVSAVVDAGQVVDQVERDDRPVRRVLLVQLDGVEVDVGGLGFVD